MTYRRRQWPVVNGCINLDEQEAHVGDAELKWAFLIASILPEVLPSEQATCSELVQQLCNRALPDGVANAVGYLCEMGHEPAARLLLMDFLKEKHDSSRLYKVLKMRLLFRERVAQGRNRNSVASTPELIKEKGAALSPEASHETDDDFRWVPASDEALYAPVMDDSAIRRAALSVQSEIGHYIASEHDAEPLDFGELGGLDDLDWELDEGEEGSGSAVKAEHVIADRIAALGDMAVELLVYFADNPGDKSIHAEYVLGYPLVEINKLLNGALRDYVRRLPSGGWECHSWVPGVLAVLVKRSP
ncbi:hypothetical protein UMZ34_04015 [Halopseudomonas pachastrellae]|nr:hypothetical protein UMZ34_04015 [Halopseudomonas pachastrellae]